MPHPHDPSQHQEGPCNVCCQPTDHCICPPCPICHSVGDPRCYGEVPRAHGLLPDKRQQISRALAVAYKQLERFEHEDARQATITARHPAFYSTLNELRAAIRCIRTL